MLPLCFGQATKACGQLLGARKAYRAVLSLGRATASGDADGEVTAERPVPEFDEAALAPVLERLAGERLQVPPMYSALKKDGRPLYELARRGEEVERAPRPIHIYRLATARVAGDSIDFEVVCSKGTYVRVLGEEIAAGLGTVGHLQSLRRLWVEPFEAEAMVSLDEVEQWSTSGGWEAGPPPGLLPVDRAFPQLPRLDLDPGQTLHLRQGRVLRLAGAPPEPGRLARAYGADAGFLGLVETAPDGCIRVQRLFVPGANGE
jgi:tRNA pseudouridine55 synthase